MGKSETPRQHAHQVTDAVIDVDLTSALETLRASESYQASDHASIVLAKNSGLRIVLIAMKSGGRMEEHRTAWPITLQGLVGETEITIGDTILALTRGRLLAVAPRVAHSVAGVDECAFLLTIGGAHDAEP
jgi:quercetin dioxygenase-like cupin family protein